MPSSTVSLVTVLSSGAQPHSLRKLCAQEHGWHEAHGWASSERANTSAQTLQPETGVGDRRPTQLQGTKNTQSRSRITEQALPAEKRSMAPCCGWGPHSPRSDNTGKTVRKQEHPTSNASAYPSLSPLISLLCSLPYPHSCQKYEASQDSAKRCRWLSEEVWFP